MEREMLKTVCSDIYELTGIKPVIYDGNMDLVYAHPRAMCDFCRELRRDEAMLRQCLACDLAGFAQCRKTGQLYIYRCHMGLTEAAAPIMDQGTVIGYVLFGQLLGEGDRPVVEARLQTGSFSNRLRLEALLAQMTPTREQIIRASARLVAMCACYIRLQNLVKRRHRDLALGLSAYIQENCAGELTIEMLCREFGISRGTLYTVSKHAFGVGITEYIRDCRVSAAIDLLRGTDTAVYQIAEKVGIGDANYLTKLVKKRTGMTPKDLRKQ